MLTFKYTARNSKTGEKVHAEVQAESEQAAAKLIRQEGLSPLEIKTNDAQVGISRIRNHIGAKDKILFSRQLSTLINAGLPLVQSLRSVSSQTQNKALKSVVNTVISDIEAGSTFSAALARHPSVFNNIFVSLIAAGEVSGTLDAALDRLAVQQEKDAEILAKVRGAMVYPIIVVVVMVAVVTFMIVKVLPQVEVLYDDIPGATLPFLTRFMLGISHFASKYWWAVVGGVVLIAFMTTRWFKTFGGRRFADRFKMSAWPIGPLFMKLYMARFARTGTTLVASGVPLIQVLEITAASVNNVHIENSIKKAIEQVRGGKALSDCLAKDPNFLDLVPNMLRIGEQSGSTEQMMAKTAEYYEKEVDNQIKTISTIIEPVLMIVLGVMALLIVAAVLLPIYGLVGKNVVT